MHPGVHNGRIRYTIVMVAHLGTFAAVGLPYVCETHGLYNHVAQSDHVACRCCTPCRPKARCMSSTSMPRPPGSCPIIAPHIVATRDAQSLQHGLQTYVCDSIMNKSLLDTPQLFTCVFQCPNGNGRPVPHGPRTPVPPP